MVTVDCGVTAFEPLAEAKRAGLDLIVIDHHQAEIALPEAIAVVDPNRIDDASPHKQLAAVGVAFLLCVGVNRALREAGWYGDGSGPSPTCANGSTSWRWARCAMSCRSPASTARWCARA